MVDELIIPERDGNLGLFFRIDERPKIMWIGGVQYTCFRSTWRELGG